MFQIAKEVHGDNGAFVKLVQLESDDFAVISRSAPDGRLQHLYIGPDQRKADEVFDGAKESLSGQDESVES